MDCAVRVCEVGLRDGLQLVKEFFPTADKIAWLELEAAAGMPEIEVTSLVPAKVMPQFADAEDVTAAALALPNLDVTVLVPHRRGLFVPEAVLTTLWVAVGVFVAWGRVAAWMTWGLSRMA